MKHIITIIVLLLSVISVSAQDKIRLYPKVSASYGDYQIRVRDDISGLPTSYRLPNFKFRTGLEMKYKKVSAYYDSSFLCEYKGTSFAPKQAIFEIGASYEVIKNIKVGASHCCLHPLHSDSDHAYNGGVFGGYNQITISYGY